jgi:alanine racemase
MAIDYNLVRVRVDLDRLRRNYLSLHRTGGNAMPVVKSDAYGHGLEAVSHTLARAGALSLAVGTVAEGVKLRQAGYDGRVICLLGAQDAPECRAVADHRLMPVVCRRDQLDMLAEAAGATPQPVALKFDTGMARLGFAPAEAAGLAELLQAAPLVPAMAMSHLATADDPDDEAFAREQETRFRAAWQPLQAHWPAIERSLANTAGLLAYESMRLDSQRPGIGLYGANPLHGTTRQHLGEGLEPAMEVSAPVLQVRELQPGQTISYGRTYAAPSHRRVAIVAAGYADAYSRGLSSPDGQGAAMALHGRRAPVLGRVCMQMTGVDVTDIPETRAGDRAFLLGGPGQAVTPEELAGWWGTIPYEVFCLLGLNPKEHSV